jgi:hypothetical protein
MPEAGARTAATTSKDDEPELAFFCPLCAELEFGGRGLDG